jgi:geranylgeranyl pyrophosphate synthase
MPDENLVLQARKIFYNHGRASIDLARKAILNEPVSYQPLRETLQYFMAGWEDVLHPALLGLACEAVGGDEQDTIELGAAFVLMAGSADLHDDIIDGSLTKDGKPTVFGKYGKDLTVLAGEALLFEGLYLLHQACECFPKEKRQTILQSVKDAFFKLSSAEAKETSLRGQKHIAAECLDMIKSKSAISEAIMKAGAIIGGGTQKEVELLGSYGRVFSYLYSLREEFIDAYEIDEVVNRYRNEFLPLPILLALKCEKKTEAIIKLLSEDELTEKQLENLLDLVFDVKEVGELKKEMLSMIETQERNLCALEKHRDNLATIIKAMIEDL